MQNPEFEQMPDLEHTRFVVREVSEIEVAGQRVLTAHVEEFDPAENEPKRVQDVIARMGPNGSYELEDYYDHPEIREAIDKYLEGRSEELKKAA